MRGFVVDAVDEMNFELLEGRWDEALYTREITFRLYHLSMIRIRGRPGHCALQLGMIRESTQPSRYIKQHSPNSSARGRPEEGYEWLMRRE